MINEAIFLLYEGGTKPEIIDKAMKKGLNLPMGPLEIADMVGLDVILGIGEEMLRGYSDHKYRPCPLLRRYVASGLSWQKNRERFLPLLIIMKKILFIIYILSLLIFIRLRLHSLKNWINRRKELMKDRCFLGGLFLLVFLMEI